LIADLLGLAVRWIHLASSLLLVGGVGLLLLAGPSDRPTARAWEARVVRAGRALVLVALASAAGLLAHQTAVLEGRPTAALERAALGRVLLETTFGVVWLVRAGLLALLGAFVWMRADLSRRHDWCAARGEAALLAVAAAALAAAAGHAAAVEPSAAWAIAVDMAHLTGAGLWLGALPALGLLLRAASREAGADARPFTVVTARRFSRCALGLVVVLVVTGLANSVEQLGSVAGLLGTRHGHFLLAKLVLFAGMLALALANRRRYLPGLAGEASAVGRPAMRRLAASVTAEAALGLVVVALVAWMSLTPPGRHTQPAWPLDFRLTPAALDEAPALAARVLVGSQVAVLGLVVLATALVLRSLRLPLAAGGLVVLGTGLGVALPPLAIDAYPTTYQRPALAYTAAAVAEGGALFREHCAPCHGVRGAGDGPAGRTLAPPPPDLRAHHTAVHTAGDLYWWITHGLRQMPAFGGRLSDEERWALVNHLRALGAAWEARTLGPAVEPGRPRVVAPDFAYGVGPTPARTLREFRGRRLVLVVLYTLPGSRPRVTQLAERYGTLTTLGVEVVAVPTDADPDAIRRLGGSPWVLFPVVTEGAREIVETYRLFADAGHAEFLVDRAGYLRAIWRADGPTERDLNLLLAEVQSLNEERVTVVLPDEHVH
jgi:putative copper resistance protein D